VIEFKLPELGENIHQGDLVRLMIAPGATVSEGQPIMELETDKAVVEVPSSISGTVKDVLVKQGEKVKVGQVVFTVDNGTGGKRAETSAPTAGAEPKHQIESAPASEPVPRSTAVTTSAPQPSLVPSEAPEISEFTLPELGENIHEGDLVRLMVSPGGAISAGEPVMELETDKAVVEVPSSVTGTVKD